MSEEKTKLIEVALPLEAINRASAHEKMPGIGPHPRGLHLWWARRPLAACRAVLFAQLVDDPSSHPEKFPTPEAQEEERQRLFSLIEELVQWENSTNETVLEKARAEIRRSCGDDLPTIYDPFSGGASIPLEAQRLGLKARGSDLNPVAVTIGKAMVEIPPLFRDQPPVHPGPKMRTHYRRAEGLAEDVRYYGEWMREEAFKRIGHLYPKVKLPQEYGGGEATVIAWIWARTVPSPDPAFADVPVPLVRSFVLSQKKGRRAWVEPVVEGNTYRFVVRSEELGDTGEAPEGTVNRKGGRCILSGTAMPFPYIREQAQAGRMGARLMAIVAEGPKGRIYLAPDEEHERIASKARPDWKSDTIICHWPGRTNVVEYGITTFGDLFTDRQLVALTTFADLVHEAREKACADALAAGLADDDTPLRNLGTGAQAYAEAVSVYLAFAVDRCSDFNNSIARWNSSNEKVMNLFARQAIPMTWDFAEADIMGNVVGGFQPATIFISECIERLPCNKLGEIFVSNAQSIIFDRYTVISTDPPYYDNIGYADLSDFFFVWLRRSLRQVYPDLFSVLSTPKDEELVATPYRHGSKEKADTFFLQGMKQAIANMARCANPDIPTTIYYAFKQKEIEQSGVTSAGWATFLQAVIDAGYAVVGTWPIRSEQSYRMVASGTNALANSVVLVCRPRPADAPRITRQEFIRALKAELPAALETLQKSSIAPADMPQSAIGPGIGIFSRYAAVLEPDDTPMPVRDALMLINAELDEYFAGLEGDFDPETRFAITWFQQHGLGEGDFGIANSIAQARGIAVEAVQHAGIVQARRGKVKLLALEELQEDWRPDTDEHLSDWECCHYLIRALELGGGEQHAAVLLRLMGGERAEKAKELAYRLYDICEKQGWAKEASRYNMLISIWRTLEDRAANLSDADLAGGDGQMSFF